jgi:RNA polymerase sigma-70 factor, ECF subfamily
VENARQATTRAQDGDWERPDDQLDRLIPLLYAELHHLARRTLGREYGERTLSTTTLLHEAYLKLAADEGEGVTARGRDYLFASASRAMRQVLVDHARRRGRAKRGGGRPHIRLEEARLAEDGPCADVLDVDRALTRLAEIRPRAARIVEGRFFGGLGLEELARALQISERTAKRDWAFARAWLFRELSEGVDHA